MKTANEQTLQVGKYFTATGAIFGRLTQPRLITKLSTHRVFFTDGDGKRDRFCDRKSAKYVGDTEQEVLEFVRWFNNRKQENDKEVDRFSYALRQEFDKELRAKLEPQSP